MGFKSFVAGVIKHFQEKDSSKSSPGAVNQQSLENYEAIEPIPVSDLMAALDGAACAMLEYSLDEEAAAEYTAMLNDMKVKISGVPEAEVISYVPMTMMKVFNRSLPLMFQHGSAERIRQVKETVFAAIHSASKGKKEQNIANINLGIMMLNCEIWEADYWIVEYTRQMGEVEEKSRKNLISFKEGNQMYNDLENGVKAMNVQKKAANEKIQSMEQTKRAIESDMGSVNVQEEYSLLEQFIETLPSVVEINRGIEKTQKLADEEHAKLVAGTKLIARTLGSEPMDEEAFRKKVMGQEESKNSDKKETSDAVQNMVHAPAADQAGVSEE